MIKKVKMYSLYERIWHWLQAAAVMILIVTGFEISYATYFSDTGFEGAVRLHNHAAAILLINAFLGLFYNVASGLLQRYVPGLADVFPFGLQHAGYYLWGIFTGAPHPFDKTPDKRLLPLQKITYFMILNVLLPLMVVTGLMKMAASYDPALVESFGGLRVLGPLHRFGAWLFASFLIVHVYMITTGPTVFSNLVSMITGNDYVDAPDEEE